MVTNDEKCRVSIVHSILQIYIHIFTALYNYISVLFIKILKCGPIPQHVAIIMDGNRRYAKRLNEKVFEGHKKGFKALEEVAFL